MPPRIIRSETAAAVNLLGVTYNTNNYGVRVLLSGAVDTLAMLKPDIEIQILDYGHNPVTWRETTHKGEKDLSLINLRYSWKLHLANNIARILLVAVLGRLIFTGKWRNRLWMHNPWLRRILKAKVNLSLAGGDSFSDIYGLGRLVYVLLPQILVIILGKPLVLLPQTYGPFSSPMSRIVARFVLRHARLVYSRDREGVVTVTELLGRDDSKVRFAPDLGFAMEAELVDEVTMSRLAELKQKGLMVGLNISSLLYMGGYTRDNMFGLRQDYPELTRILLDFLIQEIGSQVLLVPHVYGGPESVESEVTLYHQLLPEIERKYPGMVTVIDKVFTHRQVKSIIGKCDVFIGSRMHACIAAVSQGVPTVCLAYSRKFSGVMNSVSADISVVDLRVANATDAIEATRSLVSRRQEVRRELLGKLPGILTAVASVFESENLLES